jgi:hypothetical protein
MIAGIIATSAGAIGLVAGGVVAAAAHDATLIYCDTNLGLTECGAKDNAARMRAGVALLIAGGVGVGVGIPLWIFGGRRVTAHDKEKETPAAPAMTLGLGSASLRWKF